MMGLFNEYFLSIFVCSLTVVYTQCLDKPVEDEIKKIKSIEFIFS